jgi:3-oxoacyl-[acyl-carrier-protein] synthase I
MIYLNGLNALSALGADDIETIKNLNLNNSPYIESIKGYLPNSMSASLGLLPFVSRENLHRNNSFAELCIAKLGKYIVTAKELYGEKRIGIVVGTSTSAISDVEYKESLVHVQGQGLSYNKDAYEIGSISEYLRNVLNISGPCYTTATACSSSAHALICATSLIESGLCDAVIAGGTDSLSRITVGGFYSLGALSLEPCLPFHKDRHGINISEGAGFCLVSKEQLDPKAISLLGYGTTSDAHHISAPDPSGKMGIAAVKKALSMAKLNAEDIGYVNMHGTGTKLNDAMEGNIIRNIFGNKVPCSSSKHLTGHTLGAAAIVEAFLCSLILQYKIDLPYHSYAEDEYSEEFGDIDLVTYSGRKSLSNVVMSNSFAFGGNNVSLIFGV